MKVRKVKMSRKENTCRRVSINTETRNLKFLCLLNPEVITKKRGFRFYSHIVRVTVGS